MMPEEEGDKGGSRRAETVEACGRRCGVKCSKLLGTILAGVVASCCLAGSLAAPTVVRVQEPRNGAVFWAFVGRPLSILYSATVSGDGPGLGLRSFLDESVGLPSHAAIQCPASALVGSIGCEGGNLTVQYVPDPDQAGQRYAVCVLSRAVANGVTLINNTTNVTCIEINVVTPNPRFTGVMPDGTPPHWHAFDANVGCMLSFPLFATDAAWQCDTGCTNRSTCCQVVIEVATQGSDPPSPTGLPQGPPGSDVGSAAFVQDASMDTRIVTFHVEWRPVRGQERSKPYTVCIRARDIYSVVSETRCFSILVKKCQYCLQPGETMNTIALSLGTDWLQLYTANPTLLTPDDLPPYTRINTGVYYDVREGDYLGLIADRYFSTVEQMIAVNPDVQMRKDYELILGEQICVIPPVCNVECANQGASCRMV